MQRAWSTQWRTALAVTGVIATACLAAVTPITPAHAVAPCNDVLVVFARGSGEGFRAPTAVRFIDALRSRLADKATDWVEIGDLDKNGQLDNAASEYPAVDVPDWIGRPGYGGSVEIGTNELVHFLNARVQDCPGEIIVLGGYSQGADVIGWALERQGWGGLNNNTKNHIGYVALFGDPRFNTGCSWNRRDVWARDSAGCLYPVGITAGIASARQPYIPNEFRGRVGSWCSYGDGICTGQASHIPGFHGIYASGAVYQAAAEAAPRARAYRRAAVLGVSMLNYINLSYQPLEFLAPTPPPPPHVYAVQTWNSPSGKTEVKQLNATTNYGSWVGGWTTPDGWHGQDTVEYGLADHNQDGKPDLYVIHHAYTSSGQTEVKVLDGATNFTSWIGGWVTPDGWHGGTDVHYLVGDANGDTRPDVYVVLHQNSPSGNTEVKILDGATNFSTWQGGWVTPEGWHTGDDVDYVLSKCGTNGGAPHLYEVLHQNTPSGMTEVKGLNSETAYTQWLGGWVSADGQHTGQDVSYAANGCNDNGRPNIYVALHQNSPSGMTEVKVLNGASNFGSWQGGWVSADGVHSGNDVDYVMASW